MQIQKLDQKYEEFAKYTNRLGEVIFERKNKMNRWWKNSQAPQTNWRKLSCRDKAIEIQHMGSNIGNLENWHKKLVIPILGKNQERNRKSYQPSRLNIRAKYDQEIQIWTD